LENSRGEKEVEVSILEDKLEEKDKKLRFQDSSKILDNILRNQRYPSIKFGLGLLEMKKKNLTHKLVQAIIKISKQIMKN